MALIPCPECGWNVSTKAVACPQCGYPVAAEQRKTPPLPDPGNLRAWETAVGTELVFIVTGRTDGLVYGTDVYTSDSPVAAVAVHAGLLQPGETGLIKVSIVAVPAKFQGSKRNSVESRDWTTGWSGAYRVERS